MADSSEHTLALAVTSSRHLTQEQKVKLQKATKEFESLFVQMMLKSMRSAQDADSSSEDGGGSFGGESYGGDVMKSMFDTELSKHIGRQGALGIAESLYRKLTGEPLPGTAASALSDISGRRPKAEAREADVPAKAPSVRVSKKNNAGAAIPPAAVQPSAVSADNKAESRTVEGSALPPSPGVTGAAAQAEKLVMVSSTLAQQTASAGAKADAVKGAARPETGSRTGSRLTASAAALERIKAYHDIIERTADTVGVDANLLKAMIVEESGGRQHARSSRNAKGLMQLIDTTAQSMGVKNVWDPHQNIQGGARYLKQQLEKFNGDISLALASYNAGPGNVERYNGIPPFRETRNYVKRVMNLFSAFQSLESKSNDVIE